MLNVAFLVTVYSSRTFPVTVLVVRDLYQYCPYLNLRPHESCGGALVLPSCHGEGNSETRRIGDESG